jgi:NAD-dependent deacetylase
MSGREIPPRCPACGGVLRPKVVLFGEALPEDELERFIIALQEGFDIVFSIGTSSVSLHRPAGRLCRIGRHTDRGDQPGAHPTERHRRYYLPLGAAEAMTRILDELGMDIPENV